MLFRSVDNGPGDADTLEPGSGFIHRAPVFGEVHQQQGDTGRHHGGDGAEDCQNPGGQKTAAPHPKMKGGRFCAGIEF